MKAELKAEELMIGNWVKVKWLPIKITSLNANGIELQSKETFIAGPSIISVEPKFRYKDVKAITITPEILEKCGFDRFRGNTNWSEWKLNDYRFHFRPNGDCANNFGIQVAGSSGHNIVYFSWKIDYLHQLQNLYFALTGTYLTIEP